MTLSATVRDLYTSAVSDAIDNEIRYNGSVSGAARELIENNLSYVREHARIGLSPREISNWCKAGEILARFVQINTDHPLAGDRVVVTATYGGQNKVYDHALVSSVDVTAQTVTIITQPYTPFISTDRGPDDSNGLIVSCSGGYFQTVPWSDLHREHDRPANFNFWGNGARGNGALTIRRPVRGWSITSDLFY